VDFRVLRRRLGEEATVVAASTGSERAFVDEQSLLGQTYEYAVQAWTQTEQSALSTWVQGRATAEPADWTLVYLVASDGDYPGYDYWFNIDGLQAQGGSSERVNVIALYDGYEHGDSRYLLVGDSPATTQTVPVATEGGEVNMGAVDTYRELFEWMLPRYTARHYLLSFHDHGGGAVELDFGPEPGRADKSMLYDEGSRDALDPDEQGRVVGLLAELAGRPVDVVESMTCLGQMVENTFSMVDHALYHVGAESFSYVSSTYPVRFLAANPAADGLAVATYLVQDHHRGVVAQRQPCHWSLVALDALPALADAMAELASVAREWASDEPTRAVLREVVGRAQSFTLQGADIASAYVDIRDLASVLAEEAALPPEMTAAAQSVADAFDDGVVLVNEVNNGVHPETDIVADYSRARGLSVYHPNAHLPFFAEGARPPYESLSFALATGWGAYLQEVSLPSPSGPCAPVQGLSAEVQPDGGVLVSWDYPEQQLSNVDAFFCSRDDAGGFTGVYYTVPKAAGVTHYSVLDAPIEPGSYRWRVSPFRGADQEESINWSTTDLLTVE